MKWVKQKSQMCYEASFKVRHTLPSFFPPKDMSDLNEVREHILRVPSYIGNPTFLASIGWKRDQTAHLLVDRKNGQPLTAVIVGEILHDRLCCGPIGNFTDRGSFTKPLKDTKNTFVLGPPLGTPFAQDFNQATEAIKSIQETISTTNDNRNFLELTPHDKVIRFATSAWEKRVRKTYSSLSTSN
jgi:hypothetical protein